MRRLALLLLAALLPVLAQHGTNPSATALRGVPLVGTLADGNAWCYQLSSKRMVPCVPGNGSTLLAGAAWGSITGTLASQTDLASALAAKADLVLGNLSNAATARGNLGLGTAATQATSFFLQTNGTGALGSLTLTPASDIIAAIIKRNASGQTSNIVEFQTELGVFLSGITKTGAFKQAGVADGCATWASGVLGTTSNPCGTGSGSANWGGIGGTLASQTDLATALAGKEAANSNIQAHISSTSNPHSTTAAQVGAIATAGAYTDLSNASKIGTASTQVAAGNHLHAGVYEPANSNIQAHIGNTVLHIPSPTGQTGKYVTTTDGVNISWGTPAGGAHTQNTDTGTTATSFQIDSGNSGCRFKNVSGTMVLRNAADSADCALQVSTLNASSGGTQTFIEMAAPGAITAGQLGVWGDSTNRGLWSKDSSGNTYRDVKPVTATTNQWVTNIGVDGVQTKTQPAFSNLTGSIAAAQQNNPAVGAKGGVEAKACSGSDKISAIGIDGIPVCTTDQTSAGSGNYQTVQDNGTNKTQRGKLNFVPGSNVTLTITDDSVNDRTNVQIAATSSGSSPLTTKGDLFGYDTAAARIPVGSNGQVLTADSTQAAGIKWTTPTTGGAVDYVTTANIREEFMSGTGTAGQIGSLGWYPFNGGTGTATPLASEANHPGIYRLSSGATSGGSSILTLYTGAINIALVAPADNFDGLWITRPSACDSTAVYHVGYVASPTQTSSPNDGIYIEKAAGDTNWYLVTRSSGTGQEKTATAIGACTANAWHKFRLRRTNSTTVAASLNGGAEVCITSSGSGCDVNNATHITTAAFSPRALSMSASASIVTFDFDYFNLDIPVTR